MFLTESASSTLGLISEPAKGTKSSLDGNNWKANVVDVKEPGILSVIPSDRQQDRGKQPVYCMALPPSIPVVLERSVASWSFLRHLKEKGIRYVNEVQPWL